jgi:hypothetical protein
VLTCPFAKRVGPLVTCTAANKKVNPLVFPCFSDRYQFCRFYPREAEAEAEPLQEEARVEEAPVVEEERPVAQAAEEAAETVEAEEEAVEAEEKPAPTRRGLGITIEGRPAENCLECLYYGAQARVCLKLGIDVKDPRRPPCFEIEGE